MTTPEMMRALVVTQDGYSGTATGPTIDRLSDWVSLKDVPVPQPSGNEVLIKVGLANVNPSDLHYIKGEYGQPRRAGVPAGFEGMGTVVAAGSPAGEAMVGKRVAFSTSQGGSGAWASYALTDANAVAPLIDGLRDEDGAALIVNPLTAFAMVRLAKEHGAKSFVMTAGASQLCKLMTSFARDEGLAAIAIVRREEHRATLTELGAAEVLDATAPDFNQKLDATLKAHAPTILLDAVADNVSATIFSAMPRRSRWIVYGKLSSENPTLPGLGQMVFMGKVIEGFWLTDWMRRAAPEQRMEAFTTAQTRFAKGQWKTDVAAIIDLADAPDMLADALKGMNRGKVLIRP